MWHQYQYDMMLMESSMAQLHSLGQDDWNKVQQDISV